MRIAVDMLGNLLAVLVTPVNAQERAQVGELAEQVSEGATVSEVIASSNARRNQALPKQGQARHQSGQKGPDRLFGSRQPLFGRAQAKERAQEQAQIQSHRPHHQRMR